MNDLVTRLDSFIEYAEATKKFADVGFYNELKAELANLKALNKELTDVLTKLDIEFIGLKEELKLCRKKCDTEQINTAYAETIERQSVEISRLKQAENKLRQKLKSGREMYQRGYSAGAKELEAHKEVVAAIGVEYKGERPIQTRVCSTFRAETGSDKDATICHDITEALEKLNKDNG